jgi:hypothetical protein
VFRFTTRHGAHSFDAPIPERTGCQASNFAEMSFRKICETVAASSLFPGSRRSAARRAHRLAGHTNISHKK